jgi:D-aminopeptidase
MEERLSKWGWQMSRARLRDLGITIGRFPTGQHNAITDVSGVTVGHRTLVYDEPRVVRTGVTVVLPRGEGTHEESCLAAWHSFNGCGEMSGLLWIEESGLLMSPVALTDTSQVGLVRDAITHYAVDRYAGSAYWLPVAGETWDGWLNDSSAFPLQTSDVYAALDAAASGPVAEGNVGGGTGMICHDFKGGVGTSSRLVDAPSGRYTVGVLVQSNYGDRHLLRVDGVPVGREIGPDKVPLPWAEQPLSSSILIVIATDAPFVATQCKRLAQRATVGLARVGGIGASFSGDIFLAFSTGNRLSRLSRSDGDPLNLRIASPADMTPFFEATAEAVEESILNALVAAETMTGYRGHTAYALPHDELQRVMAMYRPKR